ISETETRLSSTPTRVRLTPSTAIEPFGTTDFINSLSRFIQMVVSDDFFSISSMMPVPSTWPKTKCPSSLSPTLSDLSMLTISPGLVRPRFVRRMVSDTISNSTSAFDSFAAVRQAPFMHTLSPFLRPRPNFPSLTRIMISAPLLLFETDVTMPIPFTIPVNIQQYMFNGCFENIYLQLLPL